MIYFESMRSLLDLLKIKHCSKKISLIMQSEVCQKLSIPPSLKLPSLRWINLFFFALSCDKVTLIGNHLGYQFMHATFKIG